ncbi:MAG: hypothetical protein HYV35_01055 [Lentisphaerae bacterium]|nr:hypothetical protein [Lentisphaerota bacterium]
MTSPARISPLLWLIAVMAAAALSCANLYLGDLNQDEGWYLYAAGLVAKGQLPYLDFAFSQGPVMPLVYALFQPIFTAGLPAIGLATAGGVAGGRLITVLLGLAAAAVAARLAARLVSAELRAGAALATFTLISVNVYQSYFFTVVKTYSLTALLLLAGFLALVEGQSRRRAWLIFLAGIFMAMAAGARSSAGVVLPIVFFYLLLVRRQVGALAWLYFGLGATLAAAGVFLPLLILAPEAFLYWVIKFHTLRHSGSCLMTLVYKVGFLSRVLQAYFVAFGLGIAIIVAKWAGRNPTDTPAPADISAGRSSLGMIWLSLGAISLIHFLAPFPYDDYQVFVFPLLAVALACPAVRLSGQRLVPWLTLGLLIISLGAACSSPLNQDWFIQGRDRIWWLVKDRSPLQKLRDTAELIRQETNPGDELLTQDPYLAVEANRKLPAGLEMGQFSYFPAISDDQAAVLHVFNRAGLERLLRTTEAPLAALSGYALAIQSPEVTPLTPEDKALFAAIVAERYELMTNVTHFGQASTTLVIYRKKAGKLRTIDCRL